MKLLKGTKDVRDKRDLKDVVLFVMPRLGLNDFRLAIGEQILIATMGWDEALGHEKSPEEKDQKD
jgi:hypothetical protein